MRTPRAEERIALFLRAGSARAEATRAGCDQTAPRVQGRVLVRRSAGSQRVFGQVENVVEKGTAIAPLRWSCRSPLGDLPGVALTKPLDNGAGGVGDRESRQWRFMRAWFILSITLLFFFEGQGLSLAEASLVHFACPSCPLSWAWRSKGSDEKHVATHCVGQTDDCVVEEPAVVRHCPVLDVRSL